MVVLLVETDFVAVKYALLGSIPPLALAGLRFTTASLMKAPGEVVSGWYDHITVFDKGVSLDYRIG